MSKLLHQKPADTACQKKLEMCVVFLFFLSINNLQDISERAGELHGEARAGGNLLSEKGEYLRNSGGK